MPNNNQNKEKENKNKDKGFASMDEKKRQEIVSKGGKASHGKDNKGGAESVGSEPGPMKEGDEKEVDDGASVEDGMGDEKE